MSLTAAKPQETNQFTAFRLNTKYDTFPKICPASADREWMSLGTRGWANRCLPLRIANQNGWCVLCERDYEAEWRGGNDLDQLHIHAKGAPPLFARSMFGFGILTFVIPYIFRTPPGMNLLVRGPANLPKDGIAPLEGLVETDWLPFAFTMNWKLTRPLKKVRFEKDEPIAMIVPMARYQVEELMPEIRNLDSDPALLEKYQRWEAARQQAAQMKPALSVRTQGHYIRGEEHSGERASEHQASLAVKPFVDLAPLPETNPPAQETPEPPRKGFFSSWFRR